MLTEVEPIIKNIKLHFKIDRNKTHHVLKRSREIQILHPSKVAIYQNFLVYREKYIYTVFGGSGYINVTKVKTFEDIPPCITNFCDIFHLSLHQLQPSLGIDNITASGSLRRKLDLNSLRSAFSQHKFKYNPNSFPGCFVKFKDLGSIIIFKNGSYSIVGAKCKAHVTQIYQTARNAIQP